ncbi:ANTAR domain-containing protein [Streptomyces sp. R41]|uniref:ANTAR domain-containing protein n=1 Tax=Streptomyces sp. R41 TaxID=3238632 RepID=A0AB39RA79_9ACTN
MTSVRVPPRPRAPPGFLSPDGATVGSAYAKSARDKALLKAPGASRNSPAAESGPSTEEAERHGPLARARNEQLGRALASRAVIDQARGMVMALAPCSSERAWDLLVDVSQHCNVKLRDVAAAPVATTKDDALPEQLRRELRRLHLADRR